MVYFDSGLVTGMEKIFGKKGKISMKKLLIALLFIGTLGNLVSCNVIEISKSEATMSPREEKEKLDYKYEFYDGENIDTTEENLKNIFYGTWYSRSGSLLTIDEFTFNGEDYRVDSIHFGDTNSSLNINVPSKNDLRYMISELPAISNPSGTKEMRAIYMGPAPKGFLQDSVTYYEFPPEQQNDFFVHKPNTQNNDTQNQQIPESVIKKCYNDAKEQFKNWYLKNYSDSLGDLAFCRQNGDYKSQQTPSSVTISFDMTSRDVDPYEPIFTVVANYSVEGETISLFSFDCKISR